MNLNIKLQSYIKYFFFIICFLCHFTYFGSYTPELTQLAKNTLSYIPYIGILVILFTSTFNKKFSYLQLAVMFIIYIFATAGGIEQNEIITLILLVIIFQDEDPKTLLKFFTIFYFSFFAINMILSFIGILPFNETLRHTDGSMRYSFNVSHPNQLGAFLVTIYLLLSNTLKNNKFSKPIIIISSIGFFLFIYYYVKSRTSALLIVSILFLYIIYWLLKAFKFNLKGIYKYLFIFISSTPIMCSLLTLYLSFNFDSSNKLYYYLDSILSGRLVLQQNSIMNHGLPILGQHIKYSLDSGVYDFVDNNYLRYVNSYGLIFVIALLLILYYFINQKLKKSTNKHYTIILVIIYSLLAITEGSAFYFIFNPFLLILFNNYKRKDDTTCQ